MQSGLFSFFSFFFSFQESDFSLPRRASRRRKTADRRGKHLSVVGLIFYQKFAKRTIAGNFIIDIQGGW